MYGPKWPCLLMYMSHEIDVGTGCSLGRAPRTKKTLPIFMSGVGLPDIHDYSAG